MKFEQVVCAKLKSTGAYALAGYSQGITRSDAIAALDDTGVGQLELAKDEQAVVLVRPVAGGQYLLSTMVSGATEGHGGRPWMFQRVVVLPSSSMEEIDNDVFVLPFREAQREEFEHERPLDL